MIWLCLVLIWVAGAFIGASPYWLLFLQGIAVFRAMTGLDRASFAFAIVAIAGCIMGYQGLPSQGAMGVITALVIYFWYDLNISGRVGQILIWLGEVSYSLYLTHQMMGVFIIMYLGQRFVPHNAWQAELVQALIGLAVSLVCATLFHKLIERPAIKLSKAIR